MPNLPFFPHRELIPVKYVDSNLYQILNRKFRICDRLHSATANEIYHLKIGFVSWYFQKNFYYVVSTRFFPKKFFFSFSVFVFLQDRIMNGPNLYETGIVIMRRKKKKENLFFSRKCYQIFARVNTFHGILWLIFTTFH